MHHPTPIATLAILVALALTGCTLPTVPGLTPATRTLAQAKADYQRTVEELFAYIPRDTIAEDLGASEPLQHLFRCDSPRSYNWPGEHNAILKPSTDGKHIVDRIATDWAHKPGWRMYDERNDPQTPGITLYAEDGTSIMVYFTIKRRLIVISGGSACFYLDHYDGLKEY